MDLKMMFSLTVISSIATTLFLLVNMFWKYILGNLTLEVKIFLTVTGAVKMISKLQDVNLSVFEASLKFETN